MSGVTYTDNQSKADLLKHTFSSILTEDKALSFQIIIDLGLAVYPDYPNIKVIPFNSKILQELDLSKSLAG